MLMYYTLNVCWVGTRMSLIKSILEQLETDSLIEIFAVCEKKMYTVFHFYQHFKWYWIKLVIRFDKDNTVSSWNLKCEIFIE